MLWIKAFHLVAVICWFAVLFYLPRLFVYHAMAEDKISQDRFKTMERKLLKGIGTPSMIATLFLGMWMMGKGWEYYSNSAWFLIKMPLVALLVIYHFMCAGHFKRFLNDANTKSHVYFRWFNEVPVVLLIAICILVIVKQPI